MVYINLNINYLFNINKNKLNKYIWESLKNNYSIGLLKLYIYLMITKPTEFYDKNSLNFILQIFTQFTTIHMQEKCLRNA